MARASNYNGLETSTQLIFVGWEVPQQGWTKVNVDAAVNSSSLAAGIGGLVRDSNGRWVARFQGWIRRTSIVCAEPWAIWYGLDFAHEGQRRVILESDSVEAVQAIEMGNASSST